MNGRTRLTLAFLFAVLAVIGGTYAYRTIHSKCLSRDPGIRGEVMRLPNGKLAYFDGGCWTVRPVTPSDTPF